MTQEISRSVITFSSNCIVYIRSICGNKLCQENLTLPIVLFPNLSCFVSHYPMHESARHACNTLAVMPPSHVICFSRLGFMRHRLPIRWSSPGPPNVLSFSRRMCRSVEADLSFFLYRDGSMQLPQQASPSFSPWLGSGSLQGLPTPTRMSMYVGEGIGWLCWGWVGPDSVIRGSENEDMSLFTKRKKHVTYVLCFNYLSLFLLFCNLTECQNDLRWQFLVKIEAHTKLSFVCSVLYFE